MRVLRRGWQPAAIVLGFVLSLVVPATASEASPALSPTRILLELPASPAKAKIFGVSARLVDEAERPIGGAEVTFYQSTGFGPLPIKTVTTDEQGLASLRLRETYLDRLSLGARFAGDGRYAPTQAEGEIVFRGAPGIRLPHPARHSPSPSLAVKSLVFLVVGAVWVTYGYAILLVVQMVRAP